MTGELTMPRLSDSMEEATVIRWLIHPGDAFNKGDPLVEIETDKATVVYEAESDGVLGAILVDEGESARLGEPIARLDGQGQDAGRVPVRTPMPRAATARPTATPVARRRALELGVSLHDLAGTGPGGRITRDDVERAAATTPEAASAGIGGTGMSTRVPLSPTQRTIGRRMVEAALSIPAFSASVDVDMSAVLRFREEARDQLGQSFSLNDFLVKATATTLREFPRFNASYEDDAVTLHGRVNVGIAVAADDVLLVPTVFDADCKTLLEIATETRRLIEAARRHAVTPDELTQSTFTVSNLGMFGVRSFTAIIQPAQVAILAVGELARRPVEGSQGDVSFCEQVTATLTCDHRVVYGADAARFLNRLRERLERPLALACQTSDEEN